MSKEYGSPYGKGKIFLACCKCKHGYNGFSKKKCPLPITSKVRGMDGSSGCIIEEKKKEIK